jgi:predicted secreted Zn-dependent protease
MDGILCTIALFLLLGLAVYADVQDNKQWAKFSKVHHCKVTGKMDGSLINTFNSNGSIGVGFTSDKTAFTCDDGLTYWRSN